MGGGTIYTRLTTVSAWLSGSEWLVRQHITPSDRIARGPQVESHIKHAT